MHRIVSVTAHDVRFPTSRTLAGSDAMHTSPDYSAAYVILKTDAGDGLEGHGLTFTLGRGTEVCVAAIKALAPIVVGRTLGAITSDMRGFWRAITGEQQLRWIGPEKGVIHLASAALINAVWDLYAKVERKPLWKLLADMSPEQLVSSIDFRYISDALTPEEALDMLERMAPTRARREAEMLVSGYPAYTTSAGWLGYSDEKVRALSREAVAAGWTHDRRLMMDANQVWEVGDAIANVRMLAEFEPYWIEEPTSPDDVLGHASIARAIAPIKVATGEHCQNRVIFKQLFQAEAIGFCQLDACRLGGLNEVLAVLILAAKFGVPVCPHAGGVGLCEYVQHISLFDYIAVSGSLENRVLEYVEHLHQHFVDPVVIRNGCYVPPQAPGYSVTMRPESIREFEFPTGSVWSTA